MIRRDDGVYFRYNTNGGIYFQKSTGTGSAGIAGPWVDSGPALPGGSIIDKTVPNLWAPDVRKIGDVYVLYYCVSHIGTRNSTIGYATSPNLEKGSWTDHGSMGISTQEVAPSSPYNAIDPCVIQVNGQYYMSFGSYWDGIQIVPLSPSAIAPASSFPAGVQQIEYQPTGLHPTEASFIYRYTPPGTGTPYFYLFFSEGRANGYDTNPPGPGAEYRIRVCRSPTVTGGYVDASGRSCQSGYGELVLASHDQVYGPGSQGIIDDPCGPIIYYAYANTSQSVASVNFQWGVNYLSWPNGWPIVNGTGSDQPLGFCSSASSSRARTIAATLAPSSATTRPAGALTTTTTTTNAVAVNTPNPAPGTSHNPGAVSVFPGGPSAGVCSVTVLLYLYSETVWVTPGQATGTPGVPGPGVVVGYSASSQGAGDQSFGCVPVTSTVRV
ncbi:unnamed protein product [Discula destructiva]